MNAYLWNLGYREVFYYGAYHTYLLFTCSVNH
jgi:hypothetical protein